MITLLEINKAINLTIREALKDRFEYETPIVSEDLKEPIIRPSIKVILEDSKNGKFNSSCREKTLICRVYFFAKNRDKPKFENLRVQELIEMAFIDGLEVTKDFYIPIDEVRSVVTDGVLICEFELYSVELLPDNDNSPLMETLETKLKPDN